MMSGRQKKIFVEVKPLYKKNALDLIMFGYVMGMLRVIPTMTALEGIKMFIEDNDLSEEEYPFESAKTAFYMMRAEYVKNGL
jgi:hypothetical protein